MSTSTTQTQAGRMLTAQEIYDRAAAHLLAQNRPAMNESGQCFYRTADGLRCAVGGLLNPEIDTTPFEGMSPLAALVKEDDSIESPELRGALLASGINVDEHADFLSRLQRVHDAYVPSEWQMKLIELAHDYELKPYEARP